MNYKGSGRFKLDQLLIFCLVFAAGAVGFILFKLAHIPNPGLLGSMFATGALNLAGYYPPLSTWVVSFAANAMIGIMIGRQIDHNVIRRMVALARPVAVQTVGMLVLSFICGCVMHAMNSYSGVPVPFATSLISGAAGGIAEMIIYGMSVDANVAVIAVVQLFRVVIALALIPYLSMIGDSVSEKIGGRKQYKASIEDRALRGFDIRDYAMLVICAPLGAAAGLWLEIPAGVMLGAMLASGVFALSVGKRYSFDMRLRSLAQIGLGLVLGQRMTPGVVGELAAVLLPAVVVTVIMLTGTTLLAILLYKTTELDVTTCLLCTAPAGLSQIGAFADEIGADSFTATVFHTARILGIISFYPWVVMPFLGTS